MHDGEQTRIIQKPSPDEYPPYSEIYMKLIPDDGLVLRHLKDNLPRIKELIYALPEEKLYYRYAPANGRSKRSSFI